MPWYIEAAKILGPAFLGFFFGRLQASYTDRVARSKDVQNELLKSIRACSSAAIDYHSQSMPENTWAVKAAHLKNQLLRIRTDVYIVNDLSGRKDNDLKSSLLAFFDAVTEYPFEANELAEGNGADRYAKIGLTSEKLVEELNKCRPKLF